MRWWVWRGSCRLPGSPSGVPGRAGAVAERSSRPARATSSSPWVARVQVTASRPKAELNSSRAVGAGERVDRDGDGVGLPLPGVHRRGDEHAVGEVVLLGEAVDHVLRVVHGLVAGGEHGDERVSAWVVRRPTRPASRSVHRGRRTLARRDRRAALRAVRRAALEDALRGAWSTSGASASGRPCDLEQGGYAGGHLSPNRRRTCGHLGQRRGHPPAIARGGDAVQVVPVARRTPATAAAVRRSVARRRAARPPRSTRRRRMRLARPGRGCTGVAAPRVVRRGRAAEAARRRRRRRRPGRTRRRR